MTTDEHLDVLFDKPFVPELKTFIIGEQPILSVQLYEARFVFDSAALNDPQLESRKCFTSDSESSGTSDSGNSD
jgi:hypothetical protein